MLFFSFLISTNWAPALLCVPNCTLADDNDFFSWRTGGQVGTRPGPLGEMGALDLFPCWRRRWSHDLLLLRTSPKSQRGDQNGHDHDHFQKFPSISPPFVDGCSVCLGRERGGSNAFLKFLNRHKLVGQATYCSR